MEFLSSPAVVWGIVAIALLFFVLTFTLAKRYKRCPPDKVMVVYGKTGLFGGIMKRSSRPIHGGATFVWPLIQDYDFLDLTPITMDIPLSEALSKQNIRIGVPSTFTVGISTQSGIMENAAERLLGLPISEIRQLAIDIIFGQTRVVIATMDIEEIIAKRDVFVENITEGVEVELNKVGLRLINVNVKDVTDESGYIEALGKEAAARAINDAKKKVAQRERDGEIGEAEADREKRIKVAEANADAVDGENRAEIEIANSNAKRRVKEAEAEREATAAEEVQEAKAQEEAYKAEEQAEMQRAERERATREADVIVPAEIDKRKVEIDAEADAERQRRIAAGEADAIFKKKEAEGRGRREILSNQAAGYADIVKAAQGDARLGTLLMIADDLPELVETQVEAVKNLKIDEVTVWDSMGSDGKSPSTANFMAGMLQSLPPLENLFEMAGMDLPEFIDVEKRKTNGSGDADEDVEVSVERVDDRETSGEPQSDGEQNGSDGANGLEPVDPDELDDE